MSKRIVFSSLAALLIAGIGEQAVIAALDGSGDGWSAVGAALVSFLLINPLLSVAIGIVAGTDIKKLWFLPLLTPAFWLIFSAFFARAALPAEYYGFAAVYLAVGITVMLIIRAVGLAIKS